MSRAILARKCKADPDRIITRIILWQFIWGHAICWRASFTTRFPHQQLPGTSYKSIYDHQDNQAIAAPHRSMPKPFDDNKSSANKQVLPSDPPSPVIMTSKMIRPILSSPRELHIRSKLPQLYILWSCNQGEVKWSETKTYSMLSVLNVWFVLWWPPFAIPSQHRVRTSPYKTITDLHQ